jgi:hypothetical protein
MIQAELTQHFGSNFYANPVAGAVRGEVTDSPSRVSESGTGESPASTSGATIEPRNPQALYTSGFAENAVAQRSPASLRAESQGSNREVADSPPSPQSSRRRARVVEVTFDNTDAPPAQAAEFYPMAVQDVMSQRLSSAASPPPAADHTTGGDASRSPPSPGPAPNDD